MHDVAHDLLQRNVEAHGEGDRHRDRDEELAEVYARIDELERTEIEDPRYRIVDRFEWPLGLGLLLLLGSLLAEVLVYRQGLTPELIGSLSRFARWKGIGPACTLELNPEQKERRYALFSILVSIFERAYMLVYEDTMSRQTTRLWQSWEDYMREWCRRADFRERMIDAKRQA